MSQFERIYLIDRLLRSETAPTRREICQQLEISEATFKRDLEYMRSRLQAPVQFNREKGGYRYDPAAPLFELPGLWFTPEEIQSLLLIQNLFDQMQPGILRNRLKHFESRLRRLTETAPEGFDAVGRRITILTTPIRPVAIKYFEIVVSATLRRRRIEITYYSRSRDARTERVISPQRVIYYRGNWYLDAFCHLVEEPRRFALDALQTVKPVEEAAVELSSEPDRPGYGIFRGHALRTAVLQFGEVPSRWIVQERWHPEQHLEMQPDGRAILHVPYSHEQEILMDILRYGSDVEVLEPAPLRRLVSATLQEAAAIYESGKQPATRAPQAASRISATG